MPKPQEPSRPWGPAAYEYAERVEKEYIYSYTESLHDDWDDDDDEVEEEVPEKPIEDVDLGWLLTKLPEGVTPSQVKIEFGYHASAMAYEDHRVCFYYEKTIPARPEEFKEAKRRHAEAMAKYEQDMEAYKVALREWEIEQTEERLRQEREKLERLRNNG